MRYRAKVSNLENYDTQALHGEIVAAGLNVTGIYPGNGQLIIETPVPLTPEQIVILRGRITNHVPAWFEWAEDGATKRSHVRCAEDVDRITAHRIRAFVGGADPIQEQLKILRLSIFAHDVALYPNEYNQAEKATAANARAQMKAVNVRIEAIRAEGKAYKQSKGWM